MTNDFDKDRIDEARLVAIIRSLYRLTTANRIQWKKDLITEGSFSYSTTDSTVVLRPWRRPESVNVSIRDTDGDTVAQLVLDDHYPDIDLYEQAKELYTLARREALQVDDVLDRLLTELGTEESGGEKK
jgi:hypothetical protein